MWAPWRVKPHMRIVRTETQKNEINEGFVVRRKRGGIEGVERKQFVAIPVELDVTEDEKTAHFFKSIEAAEQVADRMNGFERQKKQWLETTT